MIADLDGAKVLMLSEKGHYGSIQVLNSEESIKVCFLAICQYENNSTFYLFLCDENLSVEQDTDFKSFEEAVEDAERRSKLPVIWSYPGSVFE